MEQNEILVTVICTVYNHEQYLRKCLDGFIMQKTTFPFEVIIHDDASTDGSADIIREYAEKYPDIIRPIYQTVNQYSQHVPITRTFIVPKARGKYFAICEGDDYWIDAEKLQKQVDYMEAHPECSMTCHNSYRLNCVTGEMAVENAFRGNPIPTSRQIIVQEDGWPATASIVYRANLYLQMPAFCLNCPVGDTPLRMYMFSKGQIYYFREIMSVYRFNHNGSWTSNYLADHSIRINFLRGMTAFYRDYDAYTEYRYHEDIQEVVNNYDLIVAYASGDWKAITKNPLFVSGSLLVKLKYTIHYKFPTQYIHICRWLKGLF